MLKLKQVAQCAFLVSLLISLQGCNSIPAPTPSGSGPFPMDSTIKKTSGGTSNLYELKQLSADGFGYSDNNSVTNIRNQGLQEIAMSVGAQAGLAWRSKHIMGQLEKQDAYLRQIFNFNSLLLRDNVLPPVLEEGRETLKLSDSNTIRLADRTYKIIKQARFVTAPPNWREYLSMNFSPPERPDNSVLPTNSVEIKIWKKYVEIGWKEGIQQANNMFGENLARLKRDFKGMALYRGLRAQNMVSLPYVAKANLGITGGGNDLRINDQVLRITALPALQANSRNWKPVMTPGEY